MNQAELIKHELRHEAKNLCKQVAQPELAAHQLLLSLIPILAKVKKVAIYHAQQYEISLVPVIDYLLANDYLVYQPIAYKSVKIMRLAQIQHNTPQTIFYTSSYVLHNEIAWQDLDLVLMPLLATDKYGSRLGKGGAYYDATLSGIKPLPLLIGIGFSCQYVAKIIPVQAWDIRLNYFASENGLIKFVE